MRMVKVCPPRYYLLGLSRLVYAISLPISTMPVFGYRGIADHIITVCLSLLGTWSGEPWRPEHSTLLQVLVSIQSMILCEEPWYNEPGRETSQSQSQSTRYNNEVRAWTLQYAIYPWVSAIHAFTAHPEQTQQTSSAWRVIAQTHLRLFARDIENTSTAASKKSRQVLLEESAKNIRAALEKQGYLV